MLPPFHIMTQHEDFLTSCTFLSGAVVLISSVAAILASGFGMSIGVIIDYYLSTFMFASLST